jgi:hypothetical protein
MLDPSDLCFASPVMVDVLVHWSFGALARRLSNYLLQQALPASDEGGAMVVVRLRLASVFVFVARWSMDMNVIYGVLCTVMMFDE